MIELSTNVSGKDFLFHFNYMLKEIKMLYFNKDSFDNIELVDKYILADDDIVDNVSDINDNVEDYADFSTENSDEATEQSTNTINSAEEDLETVNDSDVSLLDFVNTEENSNSENNTEYDSTQNTNGVLLNHGVVNSELSENQEEVNDTLLDSINNYNYYWLLLLF